MLITQFSDRVVSGRVHCDRGVYQVSGKLHLDYRKGTQVHFRAAEPQDLRLSVKGSSLPFPNPEVAYGPVNSGEAVIDQYGNFQFQIFAPNSYYKNDDIMNGIGQGKILALPHIHLTVVLANGQHKEYNLKLADADIPLRSLTGFPGKRVRSTGRNTPSFFLA